MKIPLLLLFILHLSLSFAFPVTETEVDVHDGIVGVQILKDGEPDGNEIILFEGQGANVSQDGAVQERAATSNPEADALAEQEQALPQQREDLEDQVDQCAIVRQFVELISRRDPRALDMLCDDFNNVIGAATYNKAEFDRYLQDWYRMSNNQTIEITTCRQTGDCVSVDARSVSYLGQTEWRSERTGIAICFSGDKICSIRGELISLPDFNNNVTVKVDDEYNARRVEQAFTVNTETSSQGQANVRSGTLVLLFNSQSLDIDTGIVHPNTTSGDIFFLGSIRTTLPALVSWAQDGLPSFDLLNDVTPYISLIRLTDSLMAPAFPFTLVGKTKEGNYFKLDVTASVPLTSISFRYTVNPSGGTNF